MIANMPPLAVDMRNGRGEVAFNKLIAEGARPLA
jgi:hypothetical protein